MKLERVYQFLVVLLILPVKAFCQQQIPLIGQNSPHLFRFSNSVDLEIADSSAKIFPIPGTRNIMSLASGSFESTGTISVIQPNYSTRNLPFFCEKEYQFQKSTSIPLRVRLGSLDYVNKLEGKQ